MEEEKCKRYMLSKIIIKNSKENYMENITKDDFAKWTLEKTGFWGGDIGDNNKRSIWICGIEEGGEYDGEKSCLDKRIKEDLDNIDNLGIGYENSEDSCYMNSISLDKGVFKLINAIQGCELSKYNDYKKLPCKPFVKNDKKGFFKMNLFPVACGSLSKWNSHVQEVTGFSCKELYREWCRGNLGNCGKSRFDLIREWVNDNKPKLVICFGRGNKEDFKSVFFLNDSNVACCTEQICKRNLEIYFNMDRNMMVVICPFPTYRGGYSLSPNNDALIQSFGERIRSEFKKLFPNGDSGECEDKDCCLRSECIFNNNTLKS